MTPNEFITKWRASELKERSASQEHFIDLCRLLDEPTPADADPTGETYCFERGARRDAGGDGWADVWKRHHFAWEYKGRRANLDAAFNQLRQYALALENPPLLIVSDMVRFRIRRLSPTPTAGPPTSPTTTLFGSCWISTDSRWGRFPRRRSCAKAVARRRGRSHDGSEARRAARRARW